VAANVERARAQALACLGEERFRQALEEGRVLSLEQAVSEAASLGPAAGPSSPPTVGEVGTRHGLTSRELEILPLLAQRLTDREIATRLSISPRTAGNHVNNILGKFGLASRRDVAAFAERHGLLSSPTLPTTSE
jgi:DNA-binding NarL/FixJ family response regulator